MVTVEGLVTAPPEVEEPPLGGFVTAPPEVEEPPLGGFVTAPPEVESVPFPPSPPPQPAMILMAKKRIANFFEIEVFISSPFDASVVLPWVSYGVSSYLAYKSAMFKDLAKSLYNNTNVKNMQ